mgnify:CR=1 FL=1
MIFETFTSFLSENYLNSLYKISSDNLRLSALKPIISRVCDSYNFFSTFYKLFLTAGANFALRIECNPVVHVH